MSKALAAIIPHCFGNHQHCASSWCGYISSSNSYKHKSLPYGKDLSGDELKDDLSKLFNDKIKDVAKLSHLGSTQANESMNMTISSKASQRINYSEYRSLTSRVEAAVAQKNLGYRYVIHVSQRHYTVTMIITAACYGFRSCFCSCCVFCFYFACLQTVSSETCSTPAS